MQRWAVGGGDSGGTFFFVKYYHSEQPPDQRWIAARYDGNDKVWAYTPDGSTGTGYTVFHEQFHIGETGNPAGGSSGDGHDHYWPDGIFLRGDNVVVVYFDWTTWRIVKLDATTGVVVSDIPVNLDQATGDIPYSWKGAIRADESRHDWHPGRDDALKHSYADSIRPVPGGGFAMMLNKLEYRDSGEDIEYDLVFVDEDTGNLEWGINAATATGRHVTTYWGDGTVYAEYFHPGVPMFRHYTANDSGVWCTSAEDAYPWGEKGKVFQLRITDGTLLRTIERTVEGVKLTPTGICPSPGGEVYVSWTHMTISGEAHYDHTLLDADGDVVKSVSGTVRSGNRNRAAIMQPTPDADGNIYGYPRYTRWSIPDSEGRLLKLDKDDYTLSWESNTDPIYPDPNHLTGDPYFISTVTNNDFGDGSWTEASRHSSFPDQIGAYNNGEGLHESTAFTQKHSLAFGLHVGDDGKIHYRCPIERTTRGNLPGVHSRPLDSGTPETRAMTMELTPGVRSHRRTRETSLSSLENYRDPWNLVYHDRWLGNLT